MIIEEYFLVVNYCFDRIVRSLALSKADLEVL